MVSTHLFQFELVRFRLLNSLIRSAKNTSTWLQKSWPFPTRPPVRVRLREGRPPTPIVVSMFSLPSSSSPKASGWSNANFLWISRMLLKVRFLYCGNQAHQKYIMDHESLLNFRVTWTPRFVFDCWCERELGQGASTFASDAVTDLSTVEDGLIDWYTQK